MMQTLRASILCLLIMAAVIIPSMAQIANFAASGLAGCAPQVVTFSMQVTGTSNIAPSDVYVYVIEASCDTENPVKMKGDITLLR